MMQLTSRLKSSQAGSAIAARRRRTRNWLATLALPVVALLNATLAWAAPDLDVTIVTTNPTPAANALFNYVIVVTNRGTTSATGVTVLDPLPNGITFKSLGLGSINGASLACSTPANPFTRAN